MTVTRLSPRAATPEVSSTGEVSRAPEPLGLRPGVEAWEVGGRRLSTAELVDRYQPPVGGEPARYLWRDKVAADGADLARAARDGSLMGATMGAVLGAGFGLAVDAVGHLGALVTLGALGPYTGVGIVGPALVGAGFCALVAGAFEPVEQRDAARRDAVVDGRLLREVLPDGTARTTFQPGHGEGVDLAEHARARPGTPAYDDPRAWWVKQARRDEEGS
jgi:hypothetical protein